MCVCDHTKGCEGVKMRGSRIRSQIWTNFNVRHFSQVQTGQGGGSPSSCTGEPIHQEAGSWCSLNFYRITENAVTPATENPTDEELANMAGRDFQSQPNDLADIFIYPYIF